MPKPTPADATRGLACPRCGCRDLRVIRPYDAPGVRRRRRVCRHCGRVVFTVETLAPSSHPQETVIDNTFPPPSSLS